MRWTPRFRTAVFWPAYVIVGFIIFWQHGVSSDEGITLTAAWNVSRGLVPYRDFFEFYAPGSFYLLGAVFTVVGVSYVAARIVAIIFLLSSGFGAWLLSRSFLPRGVNYFVPFLWLILFSYYPLINHNTFSLFAAVWAWVALQTALRQESRWRYVLAGAATGTVVWMLQTKGAAVVAAALVVVLLHYRHRIRQLAWYAFGLVLSLLPLLLWPLPLLWYALAEFPLRHYLEVATVNRRFAILVLGIYLVLGVGLWVQRAKKEIKAVWWLGALLYAGSLSLPDPYHLVINSWVTMLLTLWLSSQRGRPELWARWVRRLTAALPGAYLAAIIVVFVAFTFAFLPTRQGKSLVQWLRLENPELQQLVSAVQHRVPADAPIYAGPFLSNAYFETRRRNPTRFSHLISTLHPPEFFAQARHELEADPPALVLLNYRAVAKYRYSQQNPVDDFFQSRYQVWQQLGDLQLLIPKIGSNAP